MIITDFFWHKKVVNQGLTVCWKLKKFFGTFIIKVPKTSSQGRRQRCIPKQDYEFFKSAKCTKFIWNWVFSQNHPKFDILVMSEFFKSGKCTKFVWNQVSSQNHPKFDILVMSEFFKSGKCTKFVWNWVSSQKYPKFDILVMSEFCMKFDILMLKITFLKKSITQNR